MSAAEVRHPTSSSHTFLLVPILLLFALLVVAVLRSPSLVSSAGIGSAVIVAAPLILATYALTLIVMAGRGGVDLSIGPLIGFINVTLVQLFAAGIVTSPVEFFLYAIGVGVAYQLIMGLIIIFVRIQPIIVALSGYLTLAGLNLVILPRPGGIAPDWMHPWGLGESIWSPVLAILAIATGAWFLFTRTAFFDHLRLMGADERTSYTSGVNITVVRLGAHVIAGVYAGLAALTFTSLISSGDPTQGSTYTLMAVTALVLGGTSLAGGRGSIIGSLLGALNIYLITYVLATFSFGMVQSFVTELAYGTILVVALLLTLFLPQIQRRMRSISPLPVFVFLGLAAVGVVLYAQDVVVAPVGASLSGSVSLSDSSGQSLAGTSLSGTSLSGESLSGQSLAGESLAGESLAGESLAGESLAGESLAGESLSGTSLSGTSLSGTSLSGTSLAAGGEAEAAPEPTGTPVVVAAVIIAALVFLIYVLYRHLNASSLALIGAVALLVLGYAAYDGGVPQPPETAAAAGAQAKVPYVFYLEGPDTAEAATGPLAASPLLSAAIFAVGAILLGTVLIFTTVPYLKARIGERALWFMAVFGVAVAALLVYGTDGFGTSHDALFTEALGAIVVGALLFVVTLPTFQTRIRNISMVMLTLLSIVALVTTFFAAGPSVAVPAAEATQPADLAAAQSVPDAGAAVAPAGAAMLSPHFHGQVLWVLAGGAILFLLMIPGVRHRVMRNVSFDPGVRTFSYTGIFIAVSAILALGAIFLVAGVEMWKFIVALVAGVIGARFFFSFLRDFRRKYPGQGRYTRLARGVGRGRSIG